MPFGHPPSSARGGQGYMPHDLPSDLNGDIASGTMSIQPEDTSFRRFADNPYPHQEHASGIPSYTSYYQEHPESEVPVVTSSGVGNEAPNRHGDYANLDITMSLLDSLSVDPDLDRQTSLQSQYRCYGSGIRTPTETFLAFLGPLPQSPEHQVQQDEPEVPQPYEDQFWHLGGDSMVLGDFVPNADGTAGVDTTDLSPGNNQLSPNVGDNNFSSATPSFDPPSSIGYNPGSFNCVPMAPWGMRNDNGPNLEQLFGQVDTGGALDETVNHNEYIPLEQALDLPPQEPEAPGGQNTNKVNRPRFWCPHDGCDRARGGKSFGRADNLRVHQRSVHNDHIPKMRHTKKKYYRMAS